MSSCREFWAGKASQRVEEQAIYNKAPLVNEDGRIYPQKRIDCCHRHQQNRTSSKTDSLRMKSICDDWRKLEPPWNVLQLVVVGSRQ